MIQHSINPRPKWRPNKPHPSIPRNSNLGVPNPLINLIPKLGNLFDKRANRAEPGNCGRRWEKRHAAGADAIAVEIFAGFGGEGGEEAGCYG